MTWDMVADIGGTNSRVARASKGVLFDKERQVTGPKGSIVAALSAFAKAQGSAPERIVIAGAGPILEGCLFITNGEDSVTAEEVKAATGAKRVDLINDFAAAAWSLVHVAETDIKTYQGKAVPAQGNRIILGPGTGFGVGALIKTAHGFHALSGEGGHVGVAPQSAFERQVFKCVLSRWPELEMAPDAALLEAEGIVSGTALPLLYASICEVNGTSAEPLDGAGIFREARAKQPEALASIEIFTRHLAQVAGNLAVTVVANGGVFFAGGVAQANAWMFDETFVAHFNAGGRFSELRRSFGLYLYENRDFGLIGAANALERT